MGGMTDSELTAENDTPGLRGIAALGEDAEALGLTEIPVEELTEDEDAYHYRGDGPNGETTGCFCSIGVDHDL